MLYKCYIYVYIYIIYIYSANHKTTQQERFKLERKAN